ncbi:hypothetical protein [Marininema halotolerans]|uniref:Protein kinase domain-containing protein n=1 Tax=Marininema halotolerans TaxID=1155944 RepID=A0A1I6R4G4_9BACL|nr:hypothetical protein [Marininema halotolerans]SFS59559.1 hypothetical protein SAMN05444972_104112 [Marininema halotolerans]
MTQEMVGPLHLCKRFQVQESLTFFNGRFIQAKSLDGVKVLLQFMNLNDPLSQKTKEKLWMNFKHPGLLSVMDVMVKEDAVILVHPIFAGEPLTAIVNKDQFLSPMRAMTLFRKLIQTQVDLQYLPVSISTSLDPRNICLFDDEPFFLFYGLTDYTTPLAQGPRSLLLYYLLSGEYPLYETKERRDFEKKIRRVPLPIRRFALDLLEQDDTCEELLAKIDQVFTELPRKHTRSRTSDAKNKWHPAAVAASSQVILSSGESVHVPVTHQRKAPTSLKERGTFHFEEKLPTVELLSRKIWKPSLIEGQLMQSELSPFIVRLNDRSKKRSYGMQTNGYGEVGFFEKNDGKYARVLLESRGFYLKQGRSYQIKILYLPYKSLRVLIQECDGMMKWTTLGFVIPGAREYQVEIEGVKGTIFREATIYEVKSDEEIGREWMTS